MTGLEQTIVWLFGLFLAAVVATAWIGKRRGDR